MGSTFVELIAAHHKLVESVVTGNISGSVGLSVFQEESLPYLKDQHHICKSSDVANINGRL